MVTRFFFLILIIMVFSGQIAGQGIETPMKKKLFSEAIKYILSGNYTSAQPLLLNLFKSDTTNGNVAYLLGVCYLNSTDEKSEAIKYLQIANRKTTKDYKGYKYKQTKAPEKCILYLAHAYHVNHRFNEALVLLTQYKHLLPEGHPDLLEADHLSNMCYSAEVLVKDSIEINIENLGENINSNADEHTPVLTTDENTLIFTSRRKGSTGGQITDDGKYFEDIYISHRKNGNWTRAEKISSNINTPNHEASIGISSNGEELLIYKDDNGNGDIYISQRIGNDWSVPEKLESNINTLNNESHGTLSADGSTLIFSSNRAEGKGGKDLYIVNRLPGGEWGIATNMGDVLNSPWDEEGPFIHPDGHTLYFSSKGHTSMGGYDLFYSELQKDGSWGKPLNMGYPLNTTVDDVFFVMSPDGKRAYYSSSKYDGYGGRDLYMMNLLSLPERSSVVVKGPVRMAGTNEIPKNILITVKEVNTGKLIGKYKPNKEGNYIIILRQGKEYQISCDAKNCRFTPERISVPEHSAFQEINKPISLDPLSILSN